MQLPFASMLYCVLTGAGMLAGAGALRVTDPKMLLEWGLSEEHTERAMDGLHIGALVACVAGLAVFVGFDLTLFFGIVMAGLSFAAAIIAGFAGQQVLSCALSGLAWRVAKPFEVGDRITMAGEAGTVLKVGLCHTSLVSDKEEVISVPNSAIFTGSLRNRSRSAITGLRQVIIPIRLPGATDLEKAFTVLERAAMATNEFVSKQNASDTVRNFPNGNMTLSAHYKQRYESELEKDHSKCPPKVLMCGQEPDGRHRVELRFFCPEVLREAVEHQGYIEIVKNLQQSGIVLN